MHPLNGALPGPYVPARVTRGALLAAEPRSPAGLLFTSRRPSGTILLTPYSMVWDWRFSRAGSMLFYWPKLLYPSSTILPFLFFLSIGWCCGAGVFGLIGCTSLSLSLALPTFFNNNNNNTYVVWLDMTTPSWRNEEVIYYYYVAHLLTSRCALVCCGAPANILLRTRVLRRTSWKTTVLYQFYSLNITWHWLKKYVQTCDFVQFWR